MCIVCIEENAFKSIIAKWLLEGVLVAYKGKGSGGYSGYIGVGRKFEV